MFLNASIASNVLRKLFLPTPGFYQAATWYLKTQGVRARRLAVIITYVWAYASVWNYTGTSHGQVWDVTQKCTQGWVQLNWYERGPFSISVSVLSKSLSQDLSETVLRSLASSVFRLGLRQKIGLRIQVQLNTLTFTKYLFFSENVHASKNSIFR